MRGFLLSVALLFLFGRRQQGQCREEEDGVASFRENELEEVEQQEADQDAGDGPGAFFLQAVPDFVEKDEQKARQRNQSVLGPEVKVHVVGMGQALQFEGIAEGGIDLAPGSGTEAEEGTLGNHSQGAFPGPQTVGVGEEVQREEGAEAPQDGLKEKGDGRGRSGKDAEENFSAGTGSDGGDRQGRPDPGRAGLGEDEANEDQAESSPEQPTILYSLFLFQEEEAESEREQKVAGQDVGMIEDGIGAPVLGSEADQQGPPASIESQVEEGLNDAEGGTGGGRPEKAAGQKNSLLFTVRGGANRLQDQEVAVEKEEGGERETAVHGKKDGNGGRQEQEAPEAIGKMKRLSPESGAQDKQARQDGAEGQQQKSGGDEAERSDQAKVHVAIVSQGIGVFKVFEVIDVLKDSLMSYNQRMSYLALYRKYRPKTFADLVGQEAIVRTLSNAVQQSKLAHAYLFTGPRGTGKTSTARILAKSINCEVGPTVEPCGLCANCLAIEKCNSLDVHEIDAASNRGIDDIRELRERVRLAPVAARQKVYIIDEVHMLTQEAFNALLKTLEEPPPNLLFILATTEPHKVLATIHSRCQRLDFGRIPLGKMSDHLEKIAEKEGINIERAGLELISRRSGGGLRDGLSLLDQLSAVYSGQPIGEVDVGTALGIIPVEGAIQLINALAEKDVAGAITQANRLIFSGFEHQAVLRELIEVFRHLALLSVVPKGDPAKLDSLEIPNSQKEELYRLSARFKKEDLILNLDELSRAEASLRLSGISPTIGLELVLIKLCVREEAVDLGQILQRMRALEERAENWGLPSSVPPPKKEKIEQVEKAENLLSSTSAEAPVFAGKNEKIENLDGLIAAIKGISRPVAGILESAAMSLSDGTLVIALPKAWKDFFQDPRKKQTLEQALKETFGRVIPYRTEIKDAARQPESRPEPATETPAQPVEAVEIREKALPVEGDDLVRLTTEIFNGRRVEKIEKNVP